MEGNSVGSTEVEKLREELARCHEEMEAVRKTDDEVREKWERDNADKVFGVAQINNRNMQLQIHLDHRRAAKEAQRRARTGAGRGASGAGGAGGSLVANTQSNKRGRAGSDEISKESFLLHGDQQHVDHSMAQHVEDESSDDEEEHLNPFSRKECRPRCMWDMRSQDPKIRKTEEDQEETKQTAKAEVKASKKKDNNSSANNSSPKEQTDETTDTVEFDPTDLGDLLSVMMEVDAGKQTAEVREVGKQTVDAGKQTVGRTGGA